MSTTPVRSGPLPTHDSTGKLLPAILCLHGGGSNEMVFKIQCRRLMWNLGSQFRFIFAQGPRESTPGFGMLPVFEGCEPFYAWVSRKFDRATQVETAPAGEIREIDMVLRKAMEENGGVETFAGVVGFSQGARIVAGLLLRQKIAERAGKDCWTKFKFGVMIGGPYPPISLMDGLTDEESEASYGLLATVPTVHAWGAGDHIKEGCIRYADLCEGDVSYKIEYEGGHHLPLQDKDARDLCDLIMAAWYAGGGKMMVGAGEKY